MAARLYYSDGLPQTAVARALGVSQPQISRILAIARERGIVRITIADYDARDTLLEQKLSKRLGLGLAIVVRASAGMRPMQVVQTLAHFAAPVISSIIHQANVVAVAGGRTLSALETQFKPGSRVVPPCFVQMMGNVTASPEVWDAVEIGRRMASRWRGQFLMLNAPAFFPDARAQRALLSLQQIRGTLDEVDRSDLALVGIGTLSNSVFVERKTLAEPDFAKLRRAGAVGEICGRYFDRKGVECNTALRDRVLSVNLESIRKIPQVIAVTVGSDRSEGLLAAIRGGLVKGIVIDSAGASALLERADM